MQTETKTITQLPIMKYFDDAKLVEKGKETLGKWRKGEKPIGAVIGLILIGTIGYGIFRWIIPAVFIALSQVFAVIASVLAVILVIVLLPAIFKLSNIHRLSGKLCLQNVALPLILKGVPKEEANDKAMNMIKVVGLAGHENKWAKYPILSGGQLQRVAIARNLVVNPQILLMDEPFGALDTVTRKQIQLFLRSIFEHAKLDPTVVFVTHSESEAVFLSSDIYILDSGPATIRHHYKIDLPEIRDESVRYSTQFTEFVNKLGSLLEDLKKETK